MTPSPRTRRHALVPTVALVLATAVTAVVTVTPPAARAGDVESATTQRTGTSGYLCTGYAGCADAGYPHFGYRQASDQMWWRMYAGHNCTNYVAYRLVRNGMSEERPWDTTGMAYNWGRANRSKTDDTPMVGAVAWWEAGDGVGSSGHVAYVQQVLSNRKIVISEDSWSGDFHWRTIVRGNGGWPTGFIHFQDRAVTTGTRPTVSGTPKVGETLSVDDGRWRPDADTSVQWYAAGEPLDGATGTSLTVTRALLRSRLSVRVEATARGYLPGRASSERTARVARGDLDVAQRPTLSGTPRVDEVLTVDPGTVSPAAESTRVRWFADGEPIAGADGLRLHLGQDQIHRRITAVVTHRREGYHALETTSAATGEVAAGRFDVTSPFSLEGRSRVGGTLAVTPGTWTPADARVDYTWLRGDEVVGSGRSHDVVGADLGSRLSVRVELTHPGYRDESIVLDASGPVTTRPTLEVTSEGLARRAVVRLRVRAEGAEAVGGRATVRIAGREVTGRVVDGRLRVLVRDLDPGRHTVRVAYEGTGVVEAARTTDRVRVRRR